MVWTTRTKNTVRSVRCVRIDGSGAAMSKTGAHYRGAVEGVGSRARKIGKALIGLTMRVSITDG